MTDQGPQAFTGVGASQRLMRLVELLEDYAWHDLEPVIREVAKLVPPGQALRQNERDRVQSGGPEVRYQKLSLERRIATGQRTIARAVARNKSFRIQTDDDGVVRIRMLKMPVTVLAERSRRRAHRLFTPQRLADELLTADIPALLGELSYNQLLSVAVELGQRLSALEKRGHTYAGELKRQEDRRLWQPGG